MDGAYTVGPFGACCSDCVCHRRPRQSWPARFDPCGYDLADEHRHYRERPLNRDRRLVRVSLRASDYFLAELLSSKQVAVAHVAPCICFSRTWFAGKRTDAPCFFLRRCDSRSGLLERVAGSCSSRTLCRAFSHGWDRGSLGG